MPPGGKARDGAGGGSVVYVGPDGAIGRSGAEDSQAASARRSSAVLTPLGASCVRTSPGGFRRSIGCSSLDGRSRVSRARALLRAALQRRVHTCATTGSEPPHVRASITCAAHKVTAI